MPGTSGHFERHGIVEAGPQRLAQTDSLRKLIASHNAVRIVYVHGIRAEGPGASAPLIQLIKDRLGYHEPDAATDTYLDLGPEPVGATIFGEPVWEGDEWRRSQPFVRHHKLKGRRDARILVDEVNYWPMLFLLKGRYLLVPEHDLSGDDHEHLDLLQQDGGVYHDWLRPADKRALKQPARGGHAALANRVLKHQIMSWGLSDAVIALGSMRVYLNHAMELAFDAVRKQGDPDADKYVVMSESLGSFVVLDAMDTQPSVRDVMARTDDLYFFANQVALLELARIQGLPSSLPPQNAADLVGAAAPERPSPMRMLRDWAQAGRTLVDRPRQIIAFSDPSDILTYRLPPIEGVNVVNLYDRNESEILGALADPAKAHSGHLQNEAVWDVLMR